MQISNLADISTSKLRDECNPILQKFLFFLGAARVVILQVLIKYISAQYTSDHNGPPF